MPRARIPDIVKPAALLLAAATLALPVQSVAAPRGCDTIGALASGSKAKHRKLAIAANREDRLDITFGGKADLFRNAQSCEIRADGDVFELRCEWDFEEDHGAARSLYSAYRIGIKGCLAVPFVEAAGGETWGKTIVRMHHTAEIDHPGETRTKIDFELLESNYGNTPKFSVVMTAEWTDR